MRCTWSGVKMVRKGRGPGACEHKAAAISAYRDALVQRLAENAPQELEQPQVLRSVHHARAGVRVHEPLLCHPVQRSVDP